MVLFDKDHPEVRHVLAQVQKTNPMLLIGGYNVDEAIWAIYQTLMHEQGKLNDDYLSTDEVYSRIDGCLQVMYAGLI